ncbi:hypothetical protein C8J57DRAFT_1530922 [Mycena rebaudengoi]|nr:hypothetical protein C8J57DRAFT_1530922 [Mycena rebaudengoi]
MPKMHRAYILGKFFMLTLNLRRRHVTATNNSEPLPMNFVRFASCAGESHEGVHIERTTFSNSNVFGYDTKWIPADHPTRNILEHRVDIRELNEGTEDPIDVETAHRAF